MYGVYQVFKKEPSQFPFFFKCVMDAVLAGEKTGLTLKEQTVLLVFLDHCFNSLVCAATLTFNVLIYPLKTLVPFGMFRCVMLLPVGSLSIFAFMPIPRLLRVITLSNIHGFK